MWTWMHVGELQVAVSDGLIRRAELPAFAELQDLLRSLRHEADELAAQAVAQGESVLAQARSAADAMHRQSLSDAAAVQHQAHEQGLAQGLAEAASQWHARHLDAQLQRASELAAHKQLMARIVVAAVERMVRTEPAQALFERALAQVGELLRDASEARLCVNPVDMPCARRAVAEMPMLRNTEVTLHVAADALLAPRSCRFESDLGVLDASLDLQLASLRQAIESACARDGAVPAPAALIDANADGPLERADPTLSTKAEA